MAQSSSKSVQRLLRAVFICFFVSGAAGLIYEILWIRMLGLVFGHTVHAITTVLVAFMAGLALGAYACGRVADRVRNLLRLYGLLEIGIGLYCLLIPWLMELIKVLYLALARSLDLSFTSLTLVQFILSAAVLLFPTTLMGATLPLLSRFFVRDIGTVGQQVGTLYAFNTFGAVIGTYLAGFELLPMMGMQLTLLFTVTLNVGVGVLIVLFDRRLGILTEGYPKGAAESSVKPQTGSSFFSWRLEEQWVVVAFAFSGAASMIYEIAWTRALSLVIGSSTYAFSAMLLSFLVGIASGSALFVRLFRKLSLSLVWFGILQLGIGISAALCYPLFERLPDVFLHAFGFSHSYGFILALQVLISLAVMILPTVFIGATFPCAAQLVSRNLSSIGGDVGRVYALNTAGAIVGSFITGFLLIPLIGVEHSIKAAIVINLVIGLVLFMVYFQRLMVQVALGFAIAAAGLLVILVPNWDHIVMSSGVSVYAQTYLQDLKHISFGDSIKENKVLYYKDGISSTVSVHQTNDNAVFLRVNGKTDASTMSDMHTQLMSGHIPALLHPHPRTALVIGLGSGVTVGALTQYDPERIDVVEIEPAVIEASSFFRKENRDALRNPRVKVITADARNFLLTTNQKYDLIVSEPSNPWIGGVASLFTVESFNLAREHLNPEGIMAQWFHGYGMATEDLRMVVASFRWVFPNATLWITSQPDYLLIGSIQPLRMDMKHIRAVYQANPMLREDMKRVHLLSPETVLSDFYLDEDDLGRFTKGADFNTDDRLPLEFSTPRNLYEETEGVNLMAMRQARKSRYPDLLGVRVEELNQPEVQYDLAMSFKNKGMTSEALEHLRAALTKDPHYAPALLESGRLKMQTPRVLEAIEDFQTLIKVNPKIAEAHYLLGLVYLRQNKMDEAIKSLTHAVNLNAEQSKYIVDLAMAYRQMNRYNDAVKQYRTALKLEPRNQRIMGALGATLILLDRASDAIEVLDKAIAIDSKDYRLKYQLGQAFLLLNRDQEAQMAFEIAITMNPRDAEPYVGLGKAWLALGDRGKALVYFKKATSINPRIAVPEV